MVWFGADPGGAKAFGLALLHPDGSFECATVSNAHEAIEWLGKSPVAIEAAGIDSPLWWSSGASGDRGADVWLRNRYKNLGGTVQSPNSLRGAVLVQGVMLASSLRRSFPRILLTESHPKALLKAWGINPKEVDASSRWLRESFRLADGRVHGDHERDALVAAVAAREGSTGRWKCDLARNRSPREQDPTAVPWGPVAYWWPNV